MLLLVSQLLYLTLFPNPQAQQSFIQLIDISRKTLAMSFLSPKQIAHVPLAQQTLTTIS